VNAQDRAEDPEELIGLIFVELSERVLGRALLRYPVPVRTLDGVHLATAAYLREQGGEVELASYDHRLVSGARALGIPLAAL
jgi:hypothetical protein